MTLHLMTLRLQPLHRKLTLWIGAAALFCSCPSSAFARPQEPDAKKQEQATTGAPEKSDPQEKSGSEAKGSEKKSQAEKDKEQWKKIVDTKRDEIRQRIRDARKQMRRGEMVQSHVRVRVKLRNGERLEGVVKNGRFVERPAGLEFIRSDMKVKGSGIRIFFYNGTSGYIFIPYRSIKSYRVLQRLSELEVKSIHDEMRAKEAKARAYAEKRRQEILAKQQKRELDKKSAAELTEMEKKAQAKAKLEAEQKRLLALAAEFPKSEGWGAERIAELKRRAIIINVYPNERERRFMDVFEDWKKGIALQQLAASEKTPTDQGGEKPGDKTESSSKKPSDPVDPNGSGGTSVPTENPNPGK